MSDFARRAVALAAVFVLVAVAVTGGTTATGGPTAADETATTDGTTPLSVDEMVSAPPASLALSDGDITASNDSIRHKNPDDYATAGDRDRLERWLEDWLVTELQTNAIDLRDGEYDRDSATLETEFPDRIEQYTDVTSEGGGVSADEGEDSVAAFETAHETQVTMTVSALQYDEQRAAYETARTEGELEDGRELARALDELATAVETSSEDLLESYERIENVTGSDLSEARHAIEAVTADIQAEQAGIRDESFAETELTVTTDREQISFLEPLAVSGQVQTVDEDDTKAPLANEAIRLEIGTQTIRTETDRDGTFDVAYRPTAAALSTEELTVGFVPENHSAYVGTQTTVPVSIDQVEPTVGDLELSETIAYGETALVSGTLTADEIPIDGVTLEVVLDGQTVGTLAVDEGAFDGDVTVPASVPDGDREFGVRLAFDEQALAETTATEPVTVRERESRISVEGVHTGDRNLAVSGTFETDDGVGLGDHPIQVRLDGTAVANVTTAADGTFDETVVLPDSIDPETASDVHLVAAYDGTASNLASSETEIGIPLLEGDTQTGSLMPSWAWIPGGAVLLGILTGGVVWMRRRDTDGSVQTERSRQEQITVSTDTSPALEPPDADTLLAHARRARSNGDDTTAVESSYGAVRQKLRPRIESDNALTHWEFYRQFRIANETGLGSNGDRLLDLTQAYERATFGHESLSDDDVEDVLEQATRLCESADRESSRGIVMND